MKAKKISLIIIALLVSQMFICVCSAENKISIRGSVFVDEVLTMPNDIILKIEGNEYNARFNETDQQYGFKDVTGNSGSIGTFHVIISSGTYKANETLTINSEQSLYLINLTVNTSEGPEEPGNNPPLIPDSPDPSHESGDVAISKTLSWTGGDPDGDDVTYDVYFGTSSSPPMKSTNQPDTSYNPGTLDYNTNYYWQIISWDEHGESADGPIWQFTTKSEPSNGGGGGDTGGGGGGGVIIPPSNQPPVAIAVVDKNTGTPGELFTFDATESNDPDGEIVEYRWDFDDGTTEITDQTMITHTFTSVGTYNVLLTVEDNEGSTGSLDDPIIIEILLGNNPPENLIVTPEKTWTHKDSDVLFTMTATDPDENDTLRFEIDWDDGNTLVSDQIVESEETFETSYQWNSFGVYTVTVIAYDEDNASTAPDSTMIYVDVIVIDDEITGWLIDMNSDGTFDVFRNIDTDKDTDLSKHNESTYLIDANDDGKWDYTFDIDTETLEAYSVEETDDSEDGSLIAILILVGLILLLFVIFAYIAYKNKKDQQKREQQKKSEKAKKSSSSSKKKDSSKKKSSKK